MLQHFIKQFTQEDLGQIVTVNKSYYLVTDELMEVCGKIKEQPQNIGIYLGENNKPSLALLDILSKKTDKKVFLNEKGEFLFICGRDIMGGSITKANVSSGLVMMQNAHDENLGYGKIIGKLDAKEKIVIQNIFDRGDFLRR